MTDRERNEFLAFMQNLIDNMTRESALEFLIGAGILEREGVLAEPYKDLYIPIRPEDWDDELNRPKACIAPALA